MNTKNDRIAKAAIEFVNAFQAKTGSRGRNGAIQSEAWNRLLESVGKNFSKNNEAARKSRRKRRIETYGRYNADTFFNGLRNEIQKSIRESFKKAS